MTTTKSANLVLQDGMRTFAFCTAIVTSMAATSVFAQQSAADGVYADRIDWGILMDMSGPASVSQSTWVVGFRDRAAMINAAGGIHGRKLNLLVEDNRFDAATDKINFEKLVGQTPVIAISGMGHSVSQAALAETIKHGKVPVIGTYTPTQALSEPVSPMVYNGFCSYRAMAEVGVGYMAETLGLSNPKVMTVAVETAGGKEYTQFVEQAAKKVGGTASFTTLKITAADATPQVQRIMAQKPDFITIYGTENTAILIMRTLAQYGLETPAFGITYIGMPSTYKALGPDAGANFSFISCFTPGGADQTEGNRELVAYANKVGNGHLAGNINYVAGWVAGQLARDALKAAGEHPTREKLVQALAGGFTLDTQGLSAPIVYTPDNHTGPQILKMFGYDYDTDSFKAYGEYADFEKYAK